MPPKFSPATDTAPVATQTEPPTAPPTERQPQPPAVPPPAWLQQQTAVQQQMLERLEEISEILSGMLYVLSGLRDGLQEFHSHWYWYPERRHRAEPR